MDVVLTAPPSIAARHKFRRHDLAVHLYAYPPLAPSTPLFSKIALCLHRHWPAFSTTRLSATATGAGGSRSGSKPPRHTSR